MKKLLPYLLAILLAGGIMTLYLSANRKSNKKIDERFSLRRHEKIPYGAWVAFQNLPQVFPQAGISVNRYEPGYWDSLSNFDEKQVLFILTGRLDADKEELKRLTTFAENGNHVFISAQYISSAADEFFNCESSSYDMSVYSIDELKIGMKLSLSSPPFVKELLYGYPGRAFLSYFTSLDTATTDILGRDEKGKPNFIRLQAGKGFVFIHLEPFAFTNYFLLHRKNIDYYEQVMSLLPRDARQVVWDEYYAAKKREQPEREKKNWFTVLMGMENEEGKNSFRAAFLLLIGLLLVYVFMEMRRKQRFIPLITRPRNDSLDFVKTIGRLYYDKGDHKNLSKKMASYFQEYVRNKYKLSTGRLDEEFVRNLSYKSGISEKELGPIVTFIKYADDAPAISPKDLADFHQQLESFYHKA